MCLVIRNENLLSEYHKFPEFFLYISSSIFVGSYNCYDLFGLWNFKRSNFEVAEFRYKNIHWFAVDINSTFDSENRRFRFKVVTL